MKRTIDVSSRSYISHNDEQLRIRRLPTQGTDGKIQEEIEQSAPIEDIGILILENHQSTISVSALNALMENNTVVIGCDGKHMPNSLMVPLASNALHTAVLRAQLKASEPLKKQLWQQTVKSKIANQAAILRTAGQNSKPLDLWRKKVRSGDPANVEGRAAAYYWKNCAGDGIHFIRDPDGEGLNSALNYGYAVVRAAIARAIVGSGLHPSVGLHHKNQYNPFCLADDLMEPYRPFVDLIVFAFSEEMNDQLSTENKRRLLSVLSIDTGFGQARKPLMLSLTTTTASLVRCLMGEASRITYPEVSGMVLENQAANGKTIV